MEYKLLGKTGLRVSRICLGTAFRGQLPDRTCEEVIGRALERGVNFIDTSNVYGEHRIGHAEALLGRVLMERRQQVVLTTKIFNPVGDGPNDRGLSRVHLLREVDASLKRLQTDYIDVLFLHEPDADTPLEESLRATEAIVSQGKARYVGLSRYPAWLAMQALAIADRRQWSPPAVVQARYNLIYREAELELLPFARDTGVAVMIYSPLAIGLLSGRFRRGEAPPADSPWGRGYRGFESLMTAKTGAVVDELVAIARRRERTPSQVALAWLLMRPEITCAIIGPDLPEQVDDGLGALGWTLDGAERARLDELSAPEWLQRP